MVSAHSHVRAALEAALPVLRTQLRKTASSWDKAVSAVKVFAGQQQSSSQQQHASRAQGQEAFAAEDDIALTTPGSLQAAARGDGRGGYLRLTPEVA
ncbi:flagellar hook-length control protein [Citrobacter koseri]|nr:flagellar hook-length control protein [Citrobacter koseri]